jgi:nitrogen fixation NifU-like protein
VSAAGDPGGYGGIPELYGEIILDHNRQPRNFGRLAAANRVAVGHNPLCGDRVAIYLRVEDERIEEIGFEGVGCAISTASASMMTEALRGKPVAEARQLFERFHALLTAGGGESGPGHETDGGSARPEREPETETEPPLGKLEVFAGVREFPMRVKCATLAWHALQAALASRAPGASQASGPREKGG